VKKRGRSIGEGEKSRGWECCYGTDLRRGESSGERRAVRGEERRGVRGEERGERTGEGGRG
jgi:hypothetical protein